MNTKIPRLNNILKFLKKEDLKKLSSTAEDTENSAALQLKVKNQKQYDEMLAFFHRRINFQMLKGSKICFAYNTRRGCNKVKECKYYHVNIFHYFLNNSSKFFNTNEATKVTNSKEITSNEESSSTVMSKIKEVFVRKKRPNYFVSFRMNHSLRDEFSAFKNLIISNNSEYETLKEKDELCHLTMCLLHIGKF